VTDANVGAGHADAVDTCRKVALRLRCAMDGRASCEQGCSLCKRLTKTIKGHPISRIDEVLSRRFAVRPRISNRMKNIQVINGALNCTFSLFQATDEEFALLFPGPQQDIQYVEDLVHLAEQSEINSALCRIWERPIRKSEAQGIHGTLFYQLERYKKWYREKREDAIEPSAINSAQTPPVRRPLKKTRFVIGVTGTLKPIRTIAFPTP
jgi:hypothetical protein